MRYEARWVLLDDFKDEMHRLCNHSEFLRAFEVYAGVPPCSLSAEDFVKWAADLQCKSLMKAMTARSLEGVLFVERADAQKFYKELLETFERHGLAFNASINQQTLH